MERFNKHRTLPLNAPQYKSIHILCRGKVYNCKTKYNIKLTLNRKQKPHINSLMGNQIARDATRKIVIVIWDFFKNKCLLTINYTSIYYELLFGIFLRINV